VAHQVNGKHGERAVLVGLFEGATAADREAEIRERFQLKDKLPSLGPTSQAH
jgi:hypothetical protein